VDFNTFNIQQLYLRQKSSSYVRDVRYFRPILETSEKHPFRPGQFVVYCFFEPQRGQCPAWVISIGLAFHIDMWRTYCCSFARGPVQSRNNQRVAYISKKCRCHWAKVPHLVIPYAPIIVVSSTNPLVAISQLCAVEKRQTLQYIAIRKFNR
jgi:hypothetical protein